MLKKSIIKLCSKSKCLKLQSISYTDYLSTPCETAVGCMPQGWIDWFIWWLASVSHQVSTWANVDQVPLHHTASIGNFLETDVLECSFARPTVWTVLITQSLPYIFQQFLWLSNNSQLCLLNLTISFKTSQGSTLSFLVGCPKSHFLAWYRTFFVYWYLKLDNHVVNSTCPKGKLGWIWRADDP